MPTHTQWHFEFLSLFNDYAFTHAFTFVKVFVYIFSFFYFAAYKLLLVWKPYKRLGRNIDKLRMSNFTGRRWVVRFWLRWVRFCTWSTRHCLIFSVAFSNDWFPSLKHFISTRAKWSEIRKFGFLIAIGMNIICQFLKFLIQLHFMMKNWKFNYGKYLSIEVSIAPDLKIRYLFYLRHIK